MPETHNIPAPSMGQPADNPTPDEFDYSFVNTTARIALYDDLKATPRVMKVDPAPTDEYIEQLASTIDEQVKRLGGKIPYMVTREVSENFIHAQFREIVVSILDGGNTIRFADQGPGIQEKEKAQRPGFSSATAAMKDYIRGVGSGLPSARDYLSVFDGTIVIEDNLNTGAVVTVSLVKQGAQQGEFTSSNPESGFGPRTERMPNTTSTPYGTNMEDMPNVPNAPNVASMANVANVPHDNVAAYQQPQPAASSGTISGIPVITAAGIPAVYIPHVELEPRERDFLMLLYREGDLRGTDVRNLTEVPQATVHRTLEKMTQKGLVQKDATKRYSLTPLGSQIAPTLL